MLLKQECNLADYQNKYVFVKKDGRTFCFRMEADAVTQIDVDVSEQDPILGAIYVGKIRNIAKNLNAAFVEFTRGRLAYLDLAGVDPACVLNRKDAKTLAQGDELLIQIIKEPLKTKDAVASTNLTIGGTFAVVSSGRKTLNFSRQLEKDFCTQLKEYIRRYQKENPFTLPDEMTEPGAIIRTNAGTLGKDQFDMIAGEMHRLQQELLGIIQKGSSRSAFSCLYREQSFVQGKCRDIPMDRTDLVVTDDAEIYETLQTFAHLPTEFYPGDRISLFELLRLGRALDEACSRKVWLKCGGYLVIDVTEALTVIDVNSGKCVSKKNKDDLIDLVNGQAALEAMRQIRLRNLSGIILIDFMKYDDKALEEQLIRRMRMLAAGDKIQTNVIDMTPLGLLEMTRKRTRPALYEELFTV
ncbi:MAG: ribonuclease E/G [Lachnospiraceae bacterium]|nr:ribonuclease E/G [Lachnospiraceae bacterium]